ncbi:MAG: hypothetical protein U0X39_04565 [Bacteroidales bacterium]
MFSQRWAKDYYPRLAGVAASNEKAGQAINQQSEIAVLILAPILSVFLVFINWIVLVLYSTKFIEVNGMIHLAALGMFFKAVSWAIAFILLAKGASNLFFWNELGANIYLLGFNIAGYKLMGLQGLGASFFLAYLIYFLQVYLIARFKYSFFLVKEFNRIFVIQFLIGLSCFATVKLIRAPYSFFAGSVLILVSTVYSYRELDKRIGLKSILTDFKQKYIGSK